MRRERVVPAAIKRARARRGVFFTVRHFDSTARVRQMPNGALVPPVDWAETAPWLAAWPLMREHVAEAVSASNRQVLAALKAHGVV